MPTLLEKLELKPKDLKDPFLRKAQARWDPVYFDQTYALENNGTSRRDAKVDHIGKHVGKIGLKIINYQKDRSDQATYDVLEKQVLGDLAIYRTQIANTMGYNLQRRLGAMEVSSTSLEDVKNLVLVALPFDYTEGFEHTVRVDKQAKSRVLNNAIPALHTAHLIMANFCDVDPQQAHLQRLADKPDISSVD